jgi:hypothetical protein
MIGDAYSHEREARRQEIENGLGLLAQDHGQWARPETLRETHSTLRKIGEQAKGHPRRRTEEADRVGAGSPLPLEEPCDGRGIGRVGC